MADEEPTNHKSDEIPETTLGNFIESNHKLLSVLGIFTALTVFSRNLPLGELGSFFSFGTVGIAILIWFELLRRVPKSPKSQDWPLAVFHILMIIVMCMVVIYWLVDFRPIWKDFLPVLVMVVILSGTTRLFIWGVGHFPRVQKVLQRPPRNIVLGRAVFFGLLFVVLFSAALLASIISRPLNRFLDAMRKDLDNTRPSIHLGSTNDSNTVR